MSVTGRELMRLLERDGWVSGGRRTHGIYYSKRFPGESHPRTTLVPDKSTPLPQPTLGAILGVRQTRLGSAGLRDLMRRV